MKYAREIKVGVLAIVCGFLLFYGFFFLKGVNIFSSVKTYHGTYAQISGLVEQAPVLIRGYKVGQVDHIYYDFTQDSAFHVEISVDKDIQIPQGTQMWLVSNGLLGGSAIELYIPQHTADTALLPHNSCLPTAVHPGLVDQLQSGILTDLEEVVAEAKVMVAHLNDQTEGDAIKNSIAHIESLSNNLDYSAQELRGLMQHKVPAIVTNADSTMANLRVITEDVRGANVAATIARVDTAIDQVNQLLTQAQSPEGTIGKLLTDNSLYTSVGKVAVSADSLLVDLKAHPKRYVHFSLFGAKDKKEKSKVR